MERLHHHAAVGPVDETRTQTETIEVGDAETRGGAPGVVLVWSPQGACHLPLAVHDGLVLGREPSSGCFVIHERRVSRRHCVFKVVDGALTIEDLGSRNGTYVDGRRLARRRRVELARARVVRCGSYLFLPARELSSQLDGVELEDGVVVGAKLRRAWDSISRTAEFSRTLLVTGESGSGKELAARRFHQACVATRAGPFIPVNCAAIPSGLAERLLFGARKGTFTGASEHAQGYIAAADGGTLLLDEIGELELEVQGKLLRVFETGQLLTLGSTRERRVDVRVCLATHRDLREQVSAGKFRKDLFYRVARPTVHLPALRDRLEEVPWLIEQVLEGAGPGLRAQTSLVERCLLLPWPGNVRELLTEVQTAARNARREGREEVCATDLEDDAGRELSPTRPEASGPPAVEPTYGPSGMSTTGAPDELEARRAELEDALMEARGNISATARALGVHRTQLRRWLARLEIDPSDFRPPSGGSRGQR